MAFTPLPHRVRNSRTREYRHAGQIREGVDDLTSWLNLPHLPGTTPAPHSSRQSHYRIVLLLVLAAGALMLAYRWWRARQSDAARPIVRPVAPEGAHMTVPPTGAEGEGEASASPMPLTASGDAPQAQTRRLQGAVASAPVRPQWRSGRGPSMAPPPVPVVARPTLPGHPHPRLPR